MKKALIIFHILFSNIFFSQELEIIYFENRIYKNPEEFKKLPKQVQRDFEPNRFSYTLTYVDGVSLYENNDFSSLVNDITEPTTEIIDLGDGNQMTFVGTSNNSPDMYKPFEKKYYKDYLTKKIHAKIFTNEPKQIIDNFFDWKWEITNETKKINGYLCKKAISNLYGYHYEAWFTEEIPISCGPEKFDGLPGLILYVRIGSTEYIASSIKLNNIKVKPKQISFNGDIYTFDELIKKDASKKYQFKSEIKQDIKNNTFTRTVKF